MTIGEAIKKCEYGLRFSDEEHDELQVMLEELKELLRFKDESEDKLCNAIYEAEVNIHNNAIDEVIKAIDENIEYYHNHPRLIILADDAMNAFIDLRDLVVRLKKVGDYY